MEADWVAEVGPELPSIDIPWEGFVDLQREPARVVDLDEAVAHPALRDALVALNAGTSGLLTSKCDVWTLTRVEIDPDEFGAPAGTAGEGVCSYIDVLRLDPARLEPGQFAPAQLTSIAFDSFPFHERWARDITAHLQTITLANGRVDLVIRAANIESCTGYGMTIYTAGCGPDAAAAYLSWENVLRAAVAATINLVFPPPSRASSSIG